MNVISEYNMVLDPVRSVVGIPTAPPLPVCEVAATKEEGSEEDQEWLVQVAEATVIEPSFSAKVRCRLVHPETKAPLLQPAQFLADLVLFAIAATSNENGSFKPHMPNNDTVCKTFERGDILGHARPLSGVKFISDTEAVSSVATTPPPREHSKEEKLKILKGIHEAINKSNVPPPRVTSRVRPPAS